MRTFSREAPVSPGAASVHSAVPPSQPTPEGHWSVSEATDTSQEKQPG